MGQIMLLTGPERRRRWNEEERRQTLEEAFSPGAYVTQVAQRHDVSTTIP
ncbi:transposase [Mesorhizobium sp. M0859]